MWHEQWTLVEPGVWRYRNGDDRATASWRDGRWTLARDGRTRDFDTLFACQEALRPSRSLGDWARRLRRA